MLLSTKKYYSNFSSSNILNNVNISTKTATEEETGVAAWVSAALLCAFGNS